MGPASIGGATHGGRRIMAAPMEEAGEVREQLIGGAVEEAGGVGQERDETDMTLPSRATNELCVYNS